MKRIFSTVLTREFLALGALLTGVFCAGSAACGAADPVHPVLLEHANVLPLAIDDAFQFRKVSSFILDPKLAKPTTNEMIQFERQSLLYKTVTNYDRLQRFGQYYNIYWRSKRPADVTLRFEYRQEKLHAYVQAQERTYHAATGTIESKFAVAGDDYREGGKVTAWRAVLILDGKIVALNQSFLWD